MEAIITNINFLISLYAHSKHHSLVYDKNFVLHLTYLAKRVSEKKN